MERVTHTVREQDGDIRLDRWFKRHFPQLTHALLEKQLRKGLIRLDGKKAQGKDRVQPGQVIEIRGQESGFLTPPPPKARSLSLDDARLIRASVLYRNAQLIVLNKPYGLPVQGGSKVNKSIDGLLDALTEEGGERPKLVHRLDRDTSGALVLARNARAAAKLAEGFSGKSIEKTYWALVQGVPQPLKGVIDLPLRKFAYGDSAREQMGVDAEEGKQALTEYRVLESLARKFALVELKPLTGRMHQLRVHMAAIGCPIVGDGKYGERDSGMSALGVANALHLHARRIVIPAAGGGKPVDVAAPLPPHMEQSFRALGLDVPKK